MKVKCRYAATTVGATSVTLTPVTTGGVLEDEDAAGDPAVFGTGTIVVTQGVTPSTNFWKATALGARYLVEITRVA